MHPAEHAWGVSPAEDQIWALAVGRYSADIAGCLLMIWRAYMDVSGTKGSFVLAGYLSDIESWAKLSKEWEQLLNSGFATRNKASGKPRFKMREMNNPRRIGNVPLFYKVIEDHAKLAVSIRFNTLEWERARRRVHVPNLQINWGLFENPFLLAYRGLMDHVHQTREIFQGAIAPDQKIDFIFDQDKHEKVIRDTWE